MPRRMSVLVPLWAVFAKRGVSSIDELRDDCEGFGSSGEIRLT